MRNRAWGQNQKDLIDEDEPDEEPCTEDEDADGFDDAFQARLYACLRDVKHDGTFSSFQSIDAHINPGLHIKDIGTVGLPLSSRDTKLIAGLCKQSPFGKGDATVIDESIRKTWELDATEFVCRNPAWGPYLEKLSSRAVQDLGVKVPTWTVAYKLLLYEEGAFFKIHCDTEKVPGMLALAWYSDVQHEIRPVTSGYRLVMTYNLVQDQGLPKQTAATLDASHAKLEGLLREWTQYTTQETFFAYPLKHQYTEASLSQQNLKVEDAAKARYLEHLCAQNGVYWFFARMTKEVSPEGWDEDETSETITLGQAVTPSGKRITLGVNCVEKSQILSLMEDLYEGRSADSEDEGDYTGNENMPPSYRYHHTVAVLVRRDHVIKLFKANENQPIDSMSNMFDFTCADSHCPEDLRHAVIRTILKKALSVVAQPDELPGHGFWNDPYYSMIGMGAVMAEVGAGGETKRTQYSDLFQRVAGYCYNNCAGHFVSEALQRTVSGQDLGKSTKLVQLVASQVARETASGEDVAWDKWLSAPMPAVPTYKHLDQRMQVFDAVQQLLQPAVVPSFQEWTNDQIRELLCSVKSYSMEDAEPLTKMIGKIAPESYIAIILPVLANKLHRAGLSRFLYLLGTQAVSDPILCSQVVIPTYQQLIPIGTSVLILPLDDLAKKTWQPTRISHQLELSTSASEFIGIVDQAMKLNLMGKAQELLQKALPEPLTADNPVWAKWKEMFVFVNVLIGLLDKHNHAPLSACASRFIAGVFQISSTYLMQSRPQRPRDWVRPNVRRDACSCEPCRAVKSFLLNPAQPSGRFSYAEKIRSHIEYSFISREDFKFDTEKGRSTYTLVIHKTNNQYTRTLKEWNADVLEHRRQLEGFKSSGVESIVGGDILEIAGLGQGGVYSTLPAGGARDRVLPPLPSLPSLPALPPLQPLQPLQPLSASMQNAAAFLTPMHAAKKSHIVDLTEDEP